MTILTPHTSFLLWDGDLREPSPRVSVCLLSDSAGPVDSLLRLPPRCAVLWFAEVVEEGIFMQETFFGNIFVFILLFPVPHALPLSAFRGNRNPALY